MKIFINGFEYWYDITTDRLWLDGNIVDRGHMTHNELLQFNNALKYDYNYNL